MVYNIDQEVYSNSICTNEYLVFQNFKSRKKHIEHRMYPNVINMVISNDPYIKKETYQNNIEKKKLK